MFKEAAFLAFNSRRVEGVGLARLLSTQAKVACSSVTPRCFCHELTWLAKAVSAMRLRAVEIAFHIDKSGLRRGIIGRVIRQRNEDKKRPIDELLAIVDATADDERPAARRLVAVRIHHELTRLARSGYHRLLASLAY